MPQPIVTNLKTRSVDAALACDTVNWPLACAETQVVGSAAAAFAVSGIMRMTVSTETLWFVTIVLVALGVSVNDPVEFSFPSRSSLMN